MSQSESHQHVETPSFNPFESAGEAELENLILIKYLDTGVTGAKVYSTGLAEPIGLADWLRAGPDTRPIDQDYIVLIPYKEGTLGESKLSIAELISTWEIPGLVLRYVLSAVSCNHIEESRNDFTWRGYEISQFTPSLFMHTSRLAMGYRREMSGKATGLRAIALVDEVMSSGFEKSATTFTANETRAAPELKELWLHALFIRATMNSWVNSLEQYTKLYRSVMSHVHRIKRNVSNSALMDILETSREFVRLCAPYLARLRHDTKCIATAIKELTDVAGPNELRRAVSEMATNSTNILDYAESHFIAIDSLIKESVQECAMSVQTNSLDFVRENLTSLNRIGKSSERQVDEMRKFAAESRQDTRDMRRLAFLTMFYLPTTAMGAIFSMPMLGLDDNLEFRAVGKLWIFVVASTVLTALTFAVSSLWDKFSNINTKRVEKEPTKQPENTVIDNEPDLQPRPHFDLTIEELVKEICSKM